MSYCTIDTLLSAIGKSGRTYDVSQILEAFHLANLAHEGQKRISGEPYICHPLEVACLLIELGMDTEPVVAAILHDVVEDTDISIDLIKKQFGDGVALLVEGVTKIGKIEFSSREEQQAENVRKMLLAMAEDIRVIIIKLADRLHNMRTLEVKTDQKRRDTSLETMEVYAPLAHRLGMSWVKEELEDIALQYLDPIAYREISESLQLRKEERMKLIETIKQNIVDRLGTEHENFLLEGRVKSIYGIYRKIYIQGKAFEEIYDIYAVRVIVETVNECYNVLGIIHDMYRPIPNRFKDYISTPKQNMYQSLHTTVIDKQAIPFEIQIRTWDMHHTAECGIAAHWKYKAGIVGKDKLEEKLAWLRQLIENQQESPNAEDIVHSIKSDFSPEEVFVFTPKGDTISLPFGSTVIDFAYAIHSEVGNRMIGAKVDGRIVSLDTVVKTGQIINIMTTNAIGHAPSRDWLKIVRTTEARSKIRNWYKKERRDDNIANGKVELDREFKRNMITLPESQEKQFILEIAKRQRFATTDEFLAAIGYGGILLSKIMPRIKEDFLLKYHTTEQEKIEKAVAIKPKIERKSSNGVIVEGLDSVLVKFARCCNPLPGDPIVGFVTRGFGVSIHKTDCVNVKATIYDPNHSERWLKAEWATTAKKETFKTIIDIIGVDRQGLLADVSIAISNMRITLHALVAKEEKEDRISIQVTLSICDLDQLQYVINNLKRLSGVETIIRTVQ